MKEVSEANCVKGSSLANDICRNYRREGLFFDEILEQAAGDKLGKKGEVYSKDMNYWIGYIYRYWHYYTAESSKAIYKLAPVETMKTNYLMFHTMAPEVAIEDLKEIYRQKNSK